jgi:hypothetical protein
MHQCNATHEGSSLKQEQLHIRFKRAGINHELMSNSDMNIELLEFKEALKDFLNSERAQMLIKECRYGDMDGEILEIAKKIFSEKHYNTLMIIGYLNNLITRYIVIRLYGMIINYFEKLGLK